jgi:hypothetical protein
LQWQRLVRIFGGAPEISFFLVEKQLILSRQSSDETPVTHELLKDSKDLLVPDLNPIKIDLYYHDNQENKFYGILVSPFIGVKVFLNSFSA